MNSLRLAARKGPALTFERQVSEADFVEITDAVAKFSQQHAGTRGDLLMLAETDDPRRQIPHRQLHHVRDRLALDDDVERLGPELGTVTGRAGDEATVLREQNPDVSLVALAFEPAEKAAHSRPALIPFLALDPRLAGPQPRAFLVVHLAK